MPKTSATHRTSIRSLFIKNNPQYIDTGSKTFATVNKQNKTNISKVNSFEFGIQNIGTVGGLKRAKVTSDEGARLKLPLSMWWGYKKGAKRLKGLCAARECQVFTELCPYSLFVHVPFPMWLSGGFRVKKFQRNVVGVVLWNHNCIVEYAESTMLLLIRRYKNCSGIMSA